jgi:hypothetical protein
VNIANKQVFSIREEVAPFWQDKHAQSRVPAPTGQPSPVNKTAREEKKPHSTKRQTVQAAGWVDVDTDTYINDRVREGQKLFGKKNYSRSRAIREMLQACAQTEMFERNQRVIVPIIQDAIRSEFRIFTNRFLWLLAKIAYQVGWILSLLIRYISLQLRNPDVAHQLQTDSEKDGRVYVADRSPGDREVEDRLWRKMEEKR